MAGAGINDISAVRTIVEEAEKNINIAQSASAGGTGRIMPFLPACTKLFLLEKLLEEFVINL